MHTILTLLLPVQLAIRPDDVVGRRILGAAQTDRPCLHTRHSNQGDLQTGTVIMHPRDQKERS